MKSRQGGVETAEAAEFEGELVAASSSAIRLARSLGRSPDDAAEVAQEAAIQAWKYRASRRGEWRPWFLSIVYRVARRRTISWLPMPLGWDRASASWPGSILPDPYLSQAMSRLPDRQRAALLLYYGEDMSVETVSNILRLSQPATKQLLARARASLRSRYGDASKETT